MNSKIVQITVRSSAIPEKNTIAVMRNTGTQRLYPSTQTSKDRCLRLINDNPNRWRSYDADHKYEFAYFNCEYIRYNAHLMETEWLVIYDNLAH